MDTFNYYPQISVCAQILMKPYSHHALNPKGRCAHTERHEQNRAFCISKLIALHAIVSTFNPMVWKKRVSVAETGKVQFLKSDGLAVNPRPGTCEGKHGFPVIRGELPLPIWVGEAFR